MQSNLILRSAHGARRWVAAAAGVLASVALVMTLASPAAHAATTGSYTITTWTQPQIGFINPPSQAFYSESATLTPPSGIPAGATITSVTGNMGWTTQPSGTNYREFLCLDANDQSCADISPSGSWYGQSTWPYNNTQLAGLPAATTSFHVTAFITGPGSSGQVLSPKRYLTTTRKIVVNYTY